MPALEALGIDVVPVSHKDMPDAFEAVASDCDFVYYLAAVHRPLDDADFDAVNHQLFRMFLKALREANNPCPVVFTSSVQVELDNPYGQSKRSAELALAEHCALAQSPGMVFRFPNLFGPHATPHSHSVVATFCYNVSRNLPLDVHDPAKYITLCYIADIVELLAAIPLHGNHLPGCHFHIIPDSLIYRVTLGDLAEAVQACSEDLIPAPLGAVPASFQRKLTSTYRTYLPNGAPPSP